MDKKLAGKLRGELFRHLDGISITSTIASLHNNNVINFILDIKSFTIQDIFNKFPSNHGYMNVALRLLSAQGWLQRSIDERDNNIDYILTKSGELTLRFPGFNTTIKAQLLNDELRGDLTLVKQFGSTQSMPFVATLGSEATPESGISPNRDLSGRWAVTFHGAESDDSTYIGEFAQRGARLFGTFLHPNGDYRFLAGHVRGNNFHLSTFDGAHVYIFSGQVNEEGKIVNADFWSGTSWHQNWSGIRNERAALPDAFQRTFLNPSYDRFEFEFPNEDGVMISIDDEK